MAKQQKDALSRLLNLANKAKEEDKVNVELKDITKDHEPITNKPSKAEKVTNIIERLKHKEEPQFKSVKIPNHIFQDIKQIAKENNISQHGKLMSSILREWITNHKRK
jgi:hypothetical protein